MISAFVLHNFAENAGIDDPNLFEGDMILSKEEIRRAEHGEDIDSSIKRGSLRFRHWPNGVVIYAIDSSLGKFLVGLTLQFKIRLKISISGNFPF